MAIILEGPDAAGKTTLAKTLMAIEPRLEFYSSGGAPKTVDDMNEFCLVQEALSLRKGMILDRITPISHPIYNNIPEATKSFLSGVLANILTSPGLIVVYCRPSNDLLMAPEKHQWKDYDTEEDKQKILTRQHEFINAYDEVFNNVPHISYDYSDTEANVDLIPLMALSQFDDEIFNILTRAGNEHKRYSLS